MSKSPEWDAHGRHKSHPRYNEPDDGNKGTKDGFVTHARQRLAGGTWADEHVDERHLYQPLDATELREVRELLERERSKAA